MDRRCFICLAAVGCFVYTETFALGAAPIADSFLVKWTDRRIAQVKPKAADKGFETVGWVSGLRHAFDLGREHQRPIFVFTYSGHLDQGRC